jgi:UDPglucose 6-dehydrogenase
MSSVAKQFDSEALIVDAVIEVNQRQGRHMLTKIKSLVGNLKGKTIAVLGLAFKPETDDMREAPAIGIIRSLVDDEAKVRAYDPVAMLEAKKVLPDIEYAEDEYAAVTGTDALVFVTEWNQFRALDLARIRDLMTTPKVADLRNIYDPDDMKELGFEYVGVGR